MMILTCNLTVSFS